MFLRSFIFLVLLCLVSCVTGPPPNGEYNLSRVALDAARAVDAPRHSPGYFRKAEDFYLSGQKHYDDREYEEAQHDFRKSREFAEKAENSARLIRVRTGEVF